MLDLRDRLVGSPRFQDLAASLPVTRWVARRRARALFDLCAGFVYSQVLVACVRVGLFEALRDGPATPDALAPRLGLSSEATARLLSAAEALRLVSRRGGGRFGLGALGAAMLGNAGVAAMVEHHALLYADLADPVALLRGESGGRLARYWPYAARSRPSVTLGPDAVAPYSDLMGASQGMIARDVLAAYDVRRHRRLLDVGGGDGRFLAAAGRHAPGLVLTLFDLPAVAERARAQLADADLAERATVIGGDAFADPLPGGADLISFVRVIHDHDDAAVLALLRAARAALAPGGRLLLAEPMAATPGAEPVGAYFAFYLLAMGSGRPRREDELRALLAEAGFGAVRAPRTRRPLLVRVLVAERGA